MWPFPTSTVLVFVIVFGAALSRRVDQRSSVAIITGTSSNSVISTESCVGPNCTFYKLTSSSEHDVTNASENYVDILDSPPFWCPKNYQLWSVDGLWYHLCQPLPCVNISVFDDHEQYSMYEKSRTTVQVVNETNFIRRICAKDTKSFNAHFKSPTCQRTKLSQHEFEIENDGSLYDKLDNRTIPIGQYFLQMDNAVVCRVGSLGHSADDLFFSCVPFTVPANNYTVHSNGSLTVNSIYAEIISGFHYVDVNATAHVCFPTNYMFETCDFFTNVDDGDELKLLHNFTLFANAEIQYYPVGDYILSEDQTHAVVCQPAEITKTELKSYMYGVAAIVSAVFSFATLAIHLIFPNINHHARSLLCHIISQFLFYVTVAVRSFVNSFPVGAPRLVVFACQYIFSLSTFCWLNVLAFELWHVFAKCQGYIAPGPRSEKKRWFMVKCVYSWGIPIVLCSFTIAISLSPDAQKKLGLLLPLSQTIWFTDQTTVFAFANGPILAILVINMVLFVWTIFNIKKLNRGSDILNSKISRKLFRVFVKLFVVMGLCWFAEIMSWYLWDQTHEEVWYLTDLINCLQGLAIFIIYVCKKSTWKVMKKKINGEVNGGSQSTKSTSSQDRSRRNGSTPPIPMRTITQSTSVKSRTDEAHTTMQNTDAEQQV